MLLLGRLGVRNLRWAFGRWLLTAAGIMLGVAVLFAVQVANESAGRSVERRFGSDPRGVVSLSVPGGDVPDEAIERAADLPEVHVVSAFVGADARFHGRERDGDPWSTWIGGGRTEEGPAYDPSVGTLEDFDQAGREPREGADEVSIGGGLADELDVGMGDLLEVDTPTGMHELEIVQVWTRIDGAHIDFGLGTSWSTARRLVGESGRVGASVALDPDADVDEWIGRHRAEFSAGVVVTPGGFDAGSFRDFVRAMNRGFGVAALTTVFVGTFLIFLTMTMQVSERIAVLGTMRALGASRRQVAGMVLGEAMALGLVATVGGLVVGMLIATVLTGFVADLYRIESAEVVVPAGAVALAIGTGIVVTLLGAGVPAVAASRLDPVVAMKRIPPSPRRSRRFALLGLAMVVVGVAGGLALPAKTNDPMILLLLAGTVLALPLAIGPLSRLVGSLTRRLAPTVGRIGILHLEREQGRSAYTMGLLLVVLSTVFALGTVQHTFESALNRIVSRTLAADMFVYAGAGLDEEDLADIRSLDEVDALTAFRWIPTRLNVGDSPLRGEIVAIDPDSYFDVLGLPLVAGTEDVVRDSLAAEDETAVVLTENDARVLGLGVGDPFPLEAPGLDVEGTIVGLVANLDGGWHPVMVADHVVDRLFGAGPASGLRLDAVEGVEPPDLESAVRARLGDRADLFFRSGDEERADAAQFNNQFFSIFSAVVLITLIVGVLGLANTLAFSIVRRTRELGILRSVGSHRRQIGGMIAVEALTLAGAAVVLAVPLGMVLSALVVKTVSTEMNATIDLRPAWGPLPAVVVAAVTMSVAAALLPARRAGRISPVDALRSE